MFCTGIGRLKTRRCRPIFLDEADGGVDQGRVADGGGCGGAFGTVEAPLPGCDDVVLRCLMLPHVAESAAGKGISGDAFEFEDTGADVRRLR